MISQIHEQTKFRLAMSKIKTLAGKHIKAYMGQLAISNTSLMKKLDQAHLVLLWSKVRLLATTQQSCTVS